MAFILHIETGTNICSVCIAKDGKKTALKESDTPNVHSRVLTPFIQELFKENHLNIKDLDAIAISKGPGSYTGLRIGTSTAKGLAYSLSCPLISVGTLQNMAYGARSNARDANTLLAPMIDARRMEVYVQLFDNQMNEKSEIEAKIIDEESFKEILQEKEIIFFGSGAQKCSKVIQHKNAIFLENQYPSSEYMIPFAEEKFHKQEFEDTAYFEPFYLKDFIATKPKKNVLG